MHDTRYISVMKAWVEEFVKICSPSSVVFTDTLTGFVSERSFSLRFSMCPFPCLSLGLSFNLMSFSPHEWPTLTLVTDNTDTFSKNRAGRIFTAQQANCTAHMIHVGLVSKSSNCLAKLLCQLTDTVQTGWHLREGARGSRDWKMEEDCGETHEADTGAWCVPQMKKKNNNDKTKRHRSIYMYTQINPWLIFKKILTAVEYSAFVLVGYSSWSMSFLTKPQHANSSSYFHCTGSEV